MKLIVGITGRLLYALNEFWPYIIFLLCTSVFILSALVLAIHRSTHQRFRQTIIAISATFMTLIGVFTLAEAYFRFVYDESDSLGFLSIAHKWQARHVRLNGSYLRDVEFNPQKRSHEFRVAVIGDSIAFGYGINDPAHRFGNQLENLLRSTGRDATVHTLARYGFGTGDEINIFHDHAYLDFDLVVWQYFFNDMFSANGTPNPAIVGQAKNRLKPKGLLSWVVQTSVFAQFIYWHLATGYDETFRELNGMYLRSYDDPNLLALHKKQIATFLSELTEKNMPVIVIMFPFLGDQALQGQTEQYEQQLSKWFKQNGADHVILLSETLRDLQNERLVVSRFDNHPNEIVHKLAAEALYQKMKGR